jgi:hypothetical protein
VASSVTVTVAPASGWPASSVTLPESEPVLSCARTGPEASAIATTASKTQESLLNDLLLVMCAPRLEKTPPIAQANWIDDYLDYELD